MKTLITKPQAGFSGNEKNSSVITAQAVLRKNLPRDKTMKTRTNKSFLTLLLQLLIINCSLLIATADATIRYVSPHGSNEPPYTSWSTSAHSIQMCIDISEPGDTIYVGNGVYEEKVVMIPGLSLIGAGIDSCFIDTRSLIYQGFFAVKFADNCILDGFQIVVSAAWTGSYWVGDAIECYNAGGIIRNIKILRANRGIVVSDADLNINFNFINDVSWGIILNNSSSIISNNYMDNIRSRGIHFESVWHYFTPIAENNIIRSFSIGIARGIGTRPTIRNNTIILNGNLARGIWGGSGDTIKVYNNLIIAENAKDGLSNTGVPTISANNFVIGNFRSSEGAIVALNYNLIINNSVHGAYSGIRKPSSQNPIIKYNNSWNNEINFYGFSPDSTNLSVNPMIMNDDTTKGELDFRLQMYSPLIDAGDPNILDVDGSRSDIGLYGGPFGMSYQYIDLPPRPPQNVMAVLDSMDVTIKWNPNTESDFNHYKLFRDTTANFIADSTTFVMSLTDTFYNHIIPPGINNYYYKLTAVDNQRNESLPSEEVAVNLTSIRTNDYPITINDYILYQNYPNPFNPTTKIAYRLKEGGYVKLYVYDIKGELVDILVNQHQEGGYYEVEFHAGVRSQQTEDRIGLASGIYIYQIMVRSNNNIPVFTEMKKMLYLK